jgi:hypothetical protein
LAREIVVLSKIILAIVTFVGVPALAMAQCRPGDHLIGEDAKSYYCSRSSCSELKGQLENDKEALRRLQKNILDTNGELKNWTKENNEAAKSAFTRAVRLLHDAVLGSLQDLSENKLTLVRKEFQRRAPSGQTWQRLLERARELESRKAKLSGIIDGLKISQYPFSNLTSAYADLKNWAKDAQLESDQISDILQEMRKDPEGARILDENKLTFASDTLKLALQPFTARSLAVGEFFVGYGYDAMAWVKSRQRIVQNIENQETNRIAICKLSAQLKRTVRDQNICAGRYPEPGSVVPSAEDCK